jgi:CheY-like chemotaxis protein
MGKKILLADDSITIQKVIELTFSDEDFEVVTVGNGRLAVEKVQEVRPDLVLCDIIMPEKDGYEVCDFIKKNASTAHIPVLLLTGAFEPFDQERASRVGCDGFLAKPFEPQTLIAKVKDLLNQAAARPASRPAAVPAAAPPPAPAPPAPAPAPSYAPVPPPAPSFMEPEPSDLTPPVPYTPPRSEPSAFIPDEPPDLYGGMEAAPEDPLAPVTPEESATLRDSAAPSEDDFSPWAQPTVEVPLETRAQAGLEAAEDPLFEEVFEDEPAKAAASEAHSPSATASYTFGESADPEPEPGGGHVGYARSTSPISPRCGRRPCRLSRPRRPPRCGAGLVGPRAPADGDGGPDAAARADAGSRPGRPGARTLFRRHQPPGARQRSRFGCG